MQGSARSSRAQAAVTDAYRTLVNLRTLFHNEYSGSIDPDCQTASRILGSISEEHWKVMQKTQVQHGDTLKAWTALILYSLQAALGDPSNVGRLVKRLKIFEADSNRILAAYRPAQEDERFKTFQRLVKDIPESNASTIQRTKNSLLKLSQIQHQTLCNAQFGLGSVEGKLTIDLLSIKDHLRSNENKAAEREALEVLELCESVLGNQWYHNATLPSHSLSRMASAYSPVARRSIRTRF